MRLIFLGAPGAGKRTQAALLASQWHIPHISTGEMLRQAIADNTVLGLKVQTYVEAGELVPDRLMLVAIGERLRQPDAQRGWILAGFPHNLSQAHALDRLLEFLRQSYDRAINFYVPPDVLMQRMLKRGHPDDTVEIVRKRLEVYYEQTAALIEYYQKRRCLAVVNGDRPPEAITDFLNTSLQSSKY
jgi:adenylate kinase